jgi:hypothetical protein
MLKNQLAAFFPLNASAFGFDGGDNVRSGLQNLHGDLDFATILEAVALTLRLAVFVLVLFTAEGLSCGIAPGAHCGAGAATGRGGLVLTLDRRKRRALSALGIPRLFPLTFVACRSAGCPCMTA